MAERARGLSPPGGHPSPRRALVLGGGGVLGFAWAVGALCALQDHAGFDAREADLIVGTSAGAVIATALACGLPADQIQRHHQGVREPGDPDIEYEYGAVSGNGYPPLPRLRPGSPHLLADVVRHPRPGGVKIAFAAAAPTGRGSLAPVGQMIDEVTRTTGHTGSWPSQPRLWVVAADYQTGQRTVFGRDRLPAAPSVADAVMASCSVPAWYAPAVIDGRSYIDGGAVSNTSVDLLAGRPIDEIYVLAPMASLHPGRARSAATLLGHAIRTRITRGILADVGRLRQEGKQVTLLAPGPDDLATMGVHPMNSRRRTAVLQAAIHNTTVQLRDQANGDDHLDPGRTP